MDAFWPVLGVNAALVAGVTFVLWLVSLRMRDVSIVDVFWPLGFVLVAWATWAQADTCVARHGWVLALVTIWGLRLGGYLFWRNHGEPEDKRYAAMRKNRGDSWPLLSLVAVFWFQGFLILVVALPVQVGLLVAEPATLTWVEDIGVAFWLVGFYFEAVGDWQLARFKADPANDGKVLDKGLWRYTRHPNYFGDFMVWWGLGLLAIRVAPWTLVGPLVMSVFLLRVSGVTLLEKTITKRRPAYREYIERTSTFFPWPPKSTDADASSD